MNLKELCESTKHELIVTILSACACFPIKNLTCNSSLSAIFVMVIKPLSAHWPSVSTRPYQHYQFQRIARCNAYAIAINLGRYSRKDLIL